MLTGHIDGVQRDVISGWAADTLSPDASVEVTIFVDGEEIGRIVADRLRQDLRKLGDYGDGRHGFVFTLSEALSASEDHDIVVRFTAVDQVLGKFRILRHRAVDEAEAAPSGVQSQSSQQPGSSLRYVLHIGQPKTGSKYLQQSFCRFQQQMLKDGICYPTEWWEITDVFAHHDLIRELGSIPNQKLDSVFASLNASRNRIVLLSCEGFCALRKENLEYLRGLIAGHPVEIVFYTRRWSDLIHSQWQQSVKEGALATFPEFYARALAYAADNQMINQKIVLDRFSEVFGHDSLRVLSFSNLQDNNQDIAENFFRCILDWGQDLVLRQDIVHESMGIFLTELIRCLNVLEAARIGASGYRTFVAYVALKDNPAVHQDVRRIFASMQDNVGQISIDDDAFPLQTIFTQMNEQYADRLVNKEFGSGFFEKKNRPFSFVRSDFLLQEGISAAVQRVHAAVVGHLAG